MSGRRNRVTITDVAARTGVSRATVSRALAGNRPMSPELSDRVLSAAQELGYQVNLVGRALRQQRSSVLGLLVPDLDNPFFASLAEHLSRVAETREMELLIASAGGDLESEARVVNSFLGRQMDALVVVPCDETASHATLKRAAAQVVTVQLDRKVLAADSHYVGCDNAGGMALVYDHVVRHVDIARQPVVFIGAGPGSSSAHERLDEFRRHFPDAQVLLGSFNSKWGMQAAEQLHASGMSKATIVVAADVIALGILSRLQALGHRVPEDFRVIGFDGIGVAPLAHPELTTVRQPVEAMCTRILDLVTMEGPEADPMDIRLTPTLVIGPSSPA